MKIFKHTELGRALIDSIKNFPEKWELYQTDRYEIFIYRKCFNAAKNKKDGIEIFDRPNAFSVIYNNLDLTETLSWVDKYLLSILINNKIKIKEISNQAKIKAEKTAN